MEKVENKILELFLFNTKLKFSEIEKQVNIRSNKLAYHLNKLCEKNILTKKEEIYSLSEASEYLLPYISGKTSALPVVLIHIGDKRQAFLHKRNKRPFKDKLSLPGGRLLITESIADCAERIMKEKRNIKAKLKKINSISLEYVQSKNKKVHSFILIFVTASTINPIKMTNIEKNRLKIISSDYNLIKKTLIKR